MPTLSARGHVWSRKELSSCRTGKMALRDIFKFRELPESETSKPFLEHLEDLRWTIVKMAITLIAAMIICFAFRGTLVRIMQAPLHEIDQNLGVLRALGITDSIVVSFHLAFYAGIVISFPLLLFFTAEFVLPALTVMEKKILFPAIGVSFGLSFELPVVVLVLVRFGLITYEFMAHTRPYAIVLIFILATIITPTPDVLTLIAMSLPMIVLYESCIWIAWFMKRRQTRAA